ncbi:MAG: hypothetical protein GF388_01285 [Candidatus Aegiribacteria sp.]|nr:hypothetical protein [Candidatus Aegiribacteria sp.]
MRKLIPLVLAFMLFGAFFVLEAQECVAPCGGDDDNGCICEGETDGCTENCTDCEADCEADCCEDCDNHEADEKEDCGCGHHETVEEPETHCGGCH